MSRHRLTYATRHVGGPRPADVPAVARISVAVGVTAICAQALLHLRALGDLLAVVFLFSLAIAAVGAVLGVVGLFLSPSGRGKVVAGSGVLLSVVNVIGLVAFILSALPNC